MDDIDGAAKCNKKCLMHSDNLRTLTKVHNPRGYREAPPQVEEHDHNH